MVCVALHGQENNWSFASAFSALINFKVWTAYFQIGMFFSPCSFFLSFREYEGVCWVYKGPAWMCWSAFPSYYDVPSQTKAPHHFMLLTIRLAHLLNHQRSLSLSLSHFYVSMSSLAVVSGITPWANATPLCQALCDAVQDPGLRLSCGISHASEEWVHMGQTPRPG